MSDKGAAVRSVFFVCLFVCLFFVCLFLWIDVLYGDMSIKGVFTCPNVHTVPFLWTDCLLGNLSGKGMFTRPSLPCSLILGIAV